MSPVATAYLLIVISHGGHCLGGGPCTLELSRTANVDAAPAVIAWGLSYGDTAVADGRVLLAGPGAPARVELDLPTVRARTEMIWSYRLTRQSDGVLLEEGRRAIVAYPPLASDVGRTLGDARILVLEEQPGLSRFLEHVGVKHQVISSYADIEMRGADIVIVGPNRLRSTLDRPQTLQAAAQRGATVLVLVQADATKILGLEVARRGAAASQWSNGHALLAGLPPELWQSWLDTGAVAVPALVVPPTEPVLELAFWPPAEGHQPTPLDASVVEKQLGRGRLILCQVPASADLDDPRTQIFLAKALDYSRTTPRPTPARSERLAASKPAQPPPARPENTVGVGND